MVGDKPLYVYYCKYSGKHALTTDCNLANAPRRHTDHALVLDTEKYLAKLYTTDGGVKLLRRRWVGGCAGPLLGRLLGRLLGVHLGRRQSWPGRQAALSLGLTRSPAAIDSDGASATAT